MFSRSTSITNKNHLFEDTAEAFKTHQLFSFPKPQSFSDITSYVHEDFKSLKQIRFVDLRKTGLSRLPEFIDEKDKYNEEFFQMSTNNQPPLKQLNIDERWTKILRENYSEQDVDAKHFLLQFANWCKTYENDFKSFCALFNDYYFQICADSESESPNIRNHSFHNIPIIFAWTSTFDFHKYCSTSMLFEVIMLWHIQALIYYHKSVLFEIESYTQNQTCQFYYNNKENNKVIPESLDQENIIKSQVINSIKNCFNHLKHAYEIWCVVIPLLLKRWTAKRKDSQLPTECSERGLSFFQSVVILKLKTLQIQYHLTTEMNSTFKFWNLNHSLYRIFQSIENNQKSKSNEFSNSPSNYKSEEFKDSVTEFKELLTKQRSTGPNIHEEHIQETKFVMDKKQIFFILSQRILILCSHIKYYSTEIEKFLTLKRNVLSDSAINLEKKKSRIHSKLSFSIFDKFSTNLAYGLLMLCLDQQQSTDGSEMFYAYQNIATHSSSQKTFSKQVIPHALDFTIFSFLADKDLSMRLQMTESNAQHDLQQTLSKKINEKMKLIQLCDDNPRQIWQILNNSYQKLKDFKAGGLLFHTTAFFEFLIFRITIKHHLYYKNSFLKIQKVSSVSTSSFANAFNNVYEQYQHQGLKEWLEFLEQIKLQAETKSDTCTLEALNYNIVFNNIYKLQLASFYNVDLSRYLNMEFTELLFFKSVPIILQELNFVLSKSTPVK